MQGICASGAEGPVMLWAPPLPPAFAAEGPKYRNLVSDFWPIIMNWVNKNEAKIVKSANRRTFYKLFFLIRPPLVNLVPWGCPHPGSSAMNRKGHIVRILESLILISLKNGIIKGVAGTYICHQCCSRRPGLEKYPIYSAQQPRID